MFLISNPLIGQRESSVLIGLKRGESQISRKVLPGESELSLGKGRDGTGGNYEVLPFHCLLE